MMLIPAGQRAFCNVLDHFYNKKEKGKSRADKERQRGVTTH